MPKLVSELAQGNTFSRSSDGGALADSATRVWKVILNTPDEALDIFAAIGVNIGDVYSQANPIPCVSIEGRADGESRLVRIITAQYRTTAGVAETGGGGGGGGGGDPKSTSPELRLSTFSVSTSYIEVPVRTWHPITPPNVRGPEEEARNPAKDMYDGITRLVPITNFTFKQFEESASQILPKRNYVGDVNSSDFDFNIFTAQERTVLFKSFNMEPHVESWGGMTFRGYMVTYELSYNYRGWDIEVPQTGFNVLAFQPNLIAPGDRDNYGQPLKHGAEGSAFDGQIEVPLSLPVGVVAGDKVRAMVKVFSYKGGGASQTPSAQPIPLNDDGTPRIHTADPPVIIKKYSVHFTADLEDVLGIRIPF